VPEGIPEKIEAKSSVLHVGCSLDDCCVERPRPPDSPLVILWNHRWEHDKDPDTFFSVLLDLRKQGREFRLIVAGESFREYPAVFDAAREQLADSIIHFGYEPQRENYLQLLKTADVVVSTARQEFFGIAVVEAIASGCYPLLPARLSYPELLPADLHGKHLYASRRDLTSRLAELARNPQLARRVNLREYVEQFSWQKIAPRYDKFFEAAVSS